MTDIAFPTLSRESVQVLRWIVVRPAQLFRSPLDGTLQTGSTQGPRWDAVLSLRPMLEADSVEIEAFLAKLGQGNRALIPYFKRKVPRGTITTSGVTVNGALSAGATQLTLAGAGNAKTLLTGDCFSVGGEFKMVVDGPYTSTAGGAMSNVKFEPPLRAAVSSGAAVTLSSPTVRMIIKSPEAGWDTQAPLRTGFDALAFEEAFT
jgi:hypothetical protein